MNEMIKKYWRYIVWGLIVIAIVLTLQFYVKPKLTTTWQGYENLILLLSAMLGIAAGLLIRMINDLINMAFDK